ncbi:MAG: SLBB domain-containing protein [Mucilaginibacter sp.]
MSNVNVDSYSDEQIRQMLKRAQASGTSDAQLIQQAQSKQMPPAQIQLLQSRIAEIRRKDNNGTNDTTQQQSGRRLSYQDTSKNSQIDPFDALKSKIYGASLFRNSVNNSFEPNLKLATPLNYIVGPDDRLLINVYGKSLINWDLPVSAEGNINIPGIGVLKVAGRTIEQATSAIKAKLIASKYAIGSGTNVEVNLGNIRSINVVLQGELMRPGTYTLPSLSTVFNALYLARGPNDIGSFRKIQLIRNNRVIRTLDLYDFLSKGSRKDDISLRDQDVILVPPYDKRVELRGEVKIPGLFEVLPGETVQDLLNFSGGFTDQAYTERIKAIQASNGQKRIVDVLEKDYKTHIPSRGDVYTIDRILDRFQNRVSITGAVFRPGPFELQSGLTISQLIKNAGGLKEDAFTGRGSLIRLNNDNTKQQISFNIADVLNNRAPDLQLQREDSLHIASVFDLRDKYKLTIKGEVRNPGEFAYADSMQVSDLIIKAGGFAEGASAKRIQVFRRVFNSDPTILNAQTAQVYTVDVDPRLGTGNINFTLKPFDIVSIYSLPGFEVQKMVNVEGEVMYPGPYAIQNKNEKISDIITLAGGLTASADIEGSSLKRDNDAILSVDKSKIDTAAFNKERVEKLKHLQNTFKDENTSNASTDSIQYRNNYIGINLKKILQKPGGNDDLILENGDILTIPKQQQIVKVNGEVLYPSAVVYSSGKSFKEYVLNAGGFSPKALKRGGYVVYPNGTVKGTRNFLFFSFHPKVKAGSEIFVPKKPISTNNVAQAILGYTTGLASLVVIMVTLFKK